MLNVDIVPDLEAIVYVIKGAYSYFCFMAEMKKTRRNFTTQQKMLAVTYYLGSEASMNDTAHKFNCSVSSLIKWIAKFRPEIEGLAPKLKEDCIKHTVKTQANRLVEQREANLNEIFELQELSLKRAKELITDEEDLNKVLKALEITFKATNPEAESEGAKTTNIQNNVYNLINKHLGDGKS